LGVAPKFMEQAAAGYRSDKDNIEVSSNNDRR